jgi:hypothetical protein
VDNLWFVNTEISLLSLPIKQNQELIIIHFCLSENKKINFVYVVLINFFTKKKQIKSLVVLINFFIFLDYFSVLS